MNEVTRPRLEGAIAVRGGRRLGFAEFGSAHGPAVVWMHGTPGARRQIPIEAREYAERQGLRIIGIDRPGIATLRTIEGESHLSGLGLAEEILATLRGLEGAGERSSAP